MLPRHSTNTCAQAFRASLLSPVAALLLAGALLVGCEGGDDTATAGICTDVAASYDATTGEAPSASNLLYQLQNGVIEQIADSGFDIVVMDYSRGGSDEEAYSAGDLDTLETAGIVALSYFSIGEAESYRYYFDESWIESSGDLQPTASAPCWLGRTNPDWEGNYKVQYWSDAWQTILMAYLDRIVDAGFDGVYLDIIDAAAALFGNGLEGAGVYTLHAAGTGGNGPLAGTLKTASGAPGPELSFCAGVCWVGPQGTLATLKGVLGV